MNLWTSLAVPLVLLGALQSCVSGCSAKYWGGEATGENPGIHYRGRSFWGAEEFRMTSNGSLSADDVEARYTPGDPNAPFYLRVQKPQLDQNVSDVMREEVAKLQGIVAVQRTQVEYFAQIRGLVTDVVHELVPLFNLLAVANIRQTESGMSLTLPNGVSVGNKQISTPADLAAILKSAAESTSKLAGVAATQPSP